MQRNLRLKMRILEEFESQVIFANYLGIHPTTVSQVIMGRYNLTGDEKDTWAAALKCGQEEIFGTDLT